MSAPRFTRPWWSRRDVLKGGAALAAASAYGSPLGPALAAIPDEYDGSKFQLKAPEPNPKRGGVLRYGITCRPPHFDVHQSGTINNLGSQGCMFDNLIRRDPRDSGKTIIPDLAHSWQISKDGKTYTFFLRKDVQFHDGAEFTADDVKATYDRISKPPAGISIPRSILFKSVSEINVRDKHTIEFKLAEARPANFIMSAFASGWNVIVRKKTLEDNQQNLRRVVDIPGTGPFKSKRRVENEVWVMERNPNYWNKEVAYLDGIEFYHGLPFSPELGSAVLVGPHGLRAHRRSGHVAQGPEHAWHVLAQLLPERDPGHLAEHQEEAVRRSARATRRPSRVRTGRARRRREGRGADDGRRLHLSLLRVRHADQGSGEAPGYQADSAAAVKEAKALMAAAGYANGIKGLDFLVRDVATFKLWAQAIQAMLQQSLNIECNLRTVVESVWFDDVASGKFDLAVGAIVSTLLDPSDYFNAWYRKGGPQNYSGWDNDDFNALLPQIDSEVDPAKRLALIRKTEEIMEREVPVFPICWEKINDVWYNYVKGHNPKDYFGIYDVVRMDTMWLDK